MSELDIDKIEEELITLNDWVEGALVSDEDWRFMGKSKERIAALVKRIKEQDKLIDNFKKYQKEHWMKFMSLEHKESFKRFR